MKQLKKMGLLLCASLVVSAMPVNALAQEDTAETSDASASLIQSTLTTENSVTQSSVNQSETSESSSSQEKTVASTTETIASSETSTTDTIASSSSIETNATETSSTIFSESTEAVSSESTATETTTTSEPQAETQSSASQVAALTASLTQEVMAASDVFPYLRQRSDLESNPITGKTTETKARAAAPGVKADDVVAIQAQAATSRMTNIYPDSNSNTPTMDFVDISSHNGNISVAQYKTLKKYGVKAVVVKLTEFTTYRNPYAKSQINNAKAAGLVVHAYHYSWFTSTAKAKAEAQYFAKYADELNLGSDAIMFNDIEDQYLYDTNTNHNANSLAFVNELKRLGYKNGQHYIGRWWVNAGKLSPSQLGYQNCWIAEYPVPTVKEQRNTSYGAWQWTSQVYFPGISFPFDMSSDYAKKVTQPYGPQGKYISLKKYFTITKKNQKIYSSFNWKVKSNSNDHLNKVYYAKGKYKHINGITYLSLYDNKNQWVGYIPSSAGTLTDSAGGKWSSYKKYVKLTGTKDLYNTSFTDAIRNKASKFKNQKLLVTGQYHHFNGKTYYSVYDIDGKVWLGYIEKVGVKLVGDQGPYRKYGHYVTITGKNNTIWSSFSWKKKIATSSVLGKTYKAKGLYRHLNGSTYYSLYDHNGTWIGYINANGGYQTTSPGGKWSSFKQNIKVTGTKNIYGKDFTKTIKHKASQYKGKTVKVTGKYQHYNGKTYYSLYDPITNKWLGYIEKAGTKKAKDQGAYIKFGRNFKITSKNYNIWSSFNWVKRYSSRGLYKKTYYAKGQYKHINGSTYYSLYDNHGKWVGYINARAGKLV
ncbi:GH25 family lysozyme [Enterococcus diestrammenae]|uniref:GH25 family lysozyme n=1 Tax=Enterococcus diestrammenae TaxID=1155073 RepID=UPI00195C45D8